VRYRRSGANGATITSNTNAIVGPSRDGTWWGSSGLDDSRFVLAANMETFLTSRDSDLDGVNLAESAGSMVEVRITNAPASVQYQDVAGATNFNNRRNPCVGDGERHPAPRRRAHDPRRRRRVPALNTHMHTGGHPPIGKHIFTRHDREPHVLLP